MHCERAVYHKDFTEASTKSTYRRAVTPFKMESEAAKKCKPGRSFFAKYFSCIGSCTGERQKKVVYTKEEIWEAMMGLRSLELKEDGIGRRVSGSGLEDAGATAPSDDGLAVEEDGSSGLGESSPRSEKDEEVDLSRNTDKANQRKKMWASADSSDDEDEEDDGVVPKTPPLPPRSKRRTVRPTRRRRTAAHRESGHKCPMTWSSFKANCPEPASSWRLDPVMLKYRNSAFALTLRQMKDKR